jgi:8-oxo-dGTP diphosphatase
MSNIFQSGERKLIPAVLIYVRSGDETLMLEKSDGRWNGIGGKCDADESFVEAAIRECEEESGLRLDRSRFDRLGTLHFPNFKPEKNEDWLVEVMTIQLRSNEKKSIRSENEEGKLHWINNDDLLDLNLYEGDRYFIPYVMRREPFSGTLWYLQGALDRAEVESQMGRFSGVSRMWKWPVLLWLGGFIVSLILQTVGQHWFGNLTSWGFNSGWQLEIAVWNLGLILLLLGLIRQSQALQAIIPGLTTLSLCLALNHWVALERVTTTWSQYLQYPAHVAGLFFNLLAVIISFVFAMRQ